MINVFLYIINKDRYNKTKDAFIFACGTSIFRNLNEEENELTALGATFLEMYDAFRLDKTIYMMNDIPKNMLEDEIIRLNPTIIYGDVTKITKNEVHTLNLTKN